MYIIQSSSSTCKTNIKLNEENCKANAIDRDVPDEENPNELKEPYSMIVRKESVESDVSQPLNTMDILTEAIKRFPQLKDTQGNMRITATLIKTGLATVAAAPKPKPLITKREAKILIEMKFSNITGPWFCSGQCNERKMPQKLATYAQFVDHLSKTHGEKYPGTECLKCATECVTPANLLAHIRNIH